MAAYSYDKELAMLDFLQKKTKGSPLSFQWTNRRMSSTSVARTHGVNFIQGRFLRGGDVLEIYLFKNFMAGAGGWKKYMKGMYAWVDKLVQDGKIATGLRYYADTDESLPISQRRLSAFEKDLAKAQAEKEKAQESSAEVGALQRELLKHFPKMDANDFNDLAGGEDLKEFYEATKDGKHILIPRRTWSTMELQRPAQEQGFKPIWPGPQATILALPFTQFQELCEAQGYTFTEGTAELAPRLKNIQTPDPSQARQYADAIRRLPERSISDEEKELALLDNHEATYKDMVEQQKSGKKLSADQQKMFNILKRVVENNETSLLAMKKRKLKEVIAQQLDKYETTRANDLAVLAKKFNPSDNSLAGTVQNRKAGLAQLVKLVSDKVIQVRNEGTYYRIVSISGTKISYF